MLASPFMVSVTTMLGPGGDNSVRIESKPIIILYRIPRGFVESFRSERELQMPGIYFLVSYGAKNGPTIYVGQADKRDDGNALLNRILGKHSAGIDEWDVAFGLTSNTPQYLGSSELNYLEQYYYDKAKSTGRFRVLNNVRPHANELDPAQKVAVNTFIEYSLYTLPKFAEMYAFEALNSGSALGRVDAGLIGKQLVLSNRKQGVYALGIMTGAKSIYVFEGATVGENKLSGQKGIPQKYVEMRDQLERDGIISNGQLSEGYEFSSVTMAADIILGRYISGNQSWKDKGGKSLSELTDSTEIKVEISNTISNEDSLENVEVGYQSFASADVTSEIEPEETEPTSDLLYLTTKKGDVSATAVMTGPKSIKVLAGSKITTSPVDHKSMAGSNNLRRELEEKGVIENSIFMRDYEFSSTSGAAKMVLGFSASGNEAWKNKDGVKLGELLKGTIHRTQ